MSRTTHCTELTNVIEEANTKLTSDIGRAMYSIETYEKKQNRTSTITSIHQ